MTEHGNTFPRDIQTRNFLNLKKALLDMNGRSLSSGMLNRGRSCCLSIKRWAKNRLLIGSGTKQEVHSESVSGIKSL